MPKLLDDPPLIDFRPGLLLGRLAQGGVFRR